MIDIINGWYYEFDSTQYILYHEVEREIRNVKTKETRIGTVRETIGYFSSISTMLVKMTQLMAKDKIDNGEISTIEKHIEELNKIKNQLVDIINPF